MSEAILRDFERLGPGVVRRRRGDEEDTNGKVKHGVRLKGENRDPPATSSITSKHTTVEKAKTKRMAPHAGKQPSSSSPKLGSSMDTSELSDEQKLALKRWQSLTDEQRKDLLSKFNEARAAAVQKKAAERLRKMESAYRPKTRQNASTDYDKWDDWAKTVADDNETPDAQRKSNMQTDAGAANSSSIFQSTIQVGVLDNKTAKIEAFCASFLFAIVFAQIILPQSLKFTFTKQFLFGAAVLFCFLADKYGRALETFGFLWGGSIGAVVFAFVGQSSGVGMVVGGLVGASNRGH